SNPLNPIISARESGQKPHKHKERHALGIKGDIYVSIKIAQKRKSRRICQCGVCNFYRNATVLNQVIYKIFSSSL
ncbi:MAG: hypothetical protein IKL29_04325, partial [Bacteroidaceae bacterium]|nr:hypothetical protein [Bacteroidaceae bacterium]